MNTKQATQCEFAGVTEVTSNDLTGNDQGALEPEEIGWRGRCACGWTSPVRYSRPSAKSAVRGHILNVSQYPVGAAAALPRVVGPPVVIRPPGASARGNGTAGPESSGADTLGNAASVLSRPAVPASEGAR